MKVTISYGIIRPTASADINYRKGKEGEREEGKVYLPFA